MEKDRILRDEGDLPAQRFESDLGNLLTIDEDLPLVQGEEAENEIDESRLAGARVADEADLFPAANMDMLVLEKLLLAIMERDIIKDDLPFETLRGCASARSSRS